MSYVLCRTRYRCIRVLWIEARGGIIHIYSVYACSYVSAYTNTGHTWVRCISSSSFVWYDGFLSSCFFARETILYIICFCLSLLFVLCLLACHWCAICRPRFKSSSIDILSLSRRHTWQETCGCLQCLLYTDRFILCTLNVKLILFANVMYTEDVRAESWLDRNISN